MLCIARPPLLVGIANDCTTDWAEGASDASKEDGVAAFAPLWLWYQAERRPDLTAGVGGFRLYCDERAVFPGHPIGGEPDSNTITFAASAD